MIRRCEFQKTRERGGVGKEGIWPKDTAADGASSACFAWQSGSGVASDFDMICTE